MMSDRWEMLLHDAKRFLDRWSPTAHAMGWTPLDLFGVHPTRPAVRFEVMGLLLLLQGGEVIALTEKGASIKRPSGAVLRFPRPAAGGVLLTEAAHAEVWMTLMPYDKREGVPLNIAAERAGKSPGTVRNWSIEHGIGRGVGGGQWIISKVALAMFLDGDEEALRLYKAGDRSECQSPRLFREDGDCRPNNSRRPRAQPHHSRCTAAIQISK